MTKLLKATISALLFLVIVQEASAQDAYLDVAFSKLEETYATHEHDRGFLINKSQPGTIKYNPVAWGMAIAMYIYQHSISQQFSASCYYNPSCSSYSRLLISEYGIIKGVFLSADRVTRCNRISASDIHPLNVDKHDHKVHENVNAYRNQP